MLVQFTGIAGLVLFGFGIIGGFIAGFYNVVAILHLIFGAVALGTWIALVGAKNIGDTTQIIQGKNTRFGINLLLYSAVFIGILFAVNWIVNRHNKRWDLTAENVYSLAPQTSSLIQGLSKNVKIVTFKGVIEDENRVDDLLRLYKDANPAKVSVESIDPNAKPHLIDVYGMKKGNLIYIEYGEGETKGVSRINETSQQAITNAILKLTRGSAKKIYFVQGHDEPNLEDGKTANGINRLALALKDENSNGEPILLGQTGKIPDDAAAVVLISPKKSLLPQEKKLLIDYGKNGGRLLLLGDPRTGEDVSDIAKEFGIEIQDTVVIDQIQRLKGPALGAQPVAFEYNKSSPITKELSPQNPSVFNIAATVTKIGEGIPGAAYIQLLQSSPTAWGEKNLAALFATEPSATKEAGDIDGPVTLAISYEKKLEETTQTKGDAKGENNFDKVSRIVVFGDSDWILNGNLHVYSNRDLFLNCINWLAGEEGGYSIREGTMKLSQAPISENTYMYIFLTSFLAPELLLLLGLSVWWKRQSSAYGRNPSLTQNFA